MWSSWCRYMMVFFRSVITWVQGNYGLYRSGCRLDRHEAIGEYTRSGGTDVGLTR
jgi:hypothetical protein